MENEIIAIALCMLWFIGCATNFIPREYIWLSTIIVIYVLCRIL